MSPVELHAARPEPDAWVAGTDAAPFAERWAAMARADEVVTRVERANVRELLPLADALGAARWTLVLRREGIPACRLGMAAPRMLQAAARAEARGIVVATRGLPICLMGPYARLAVRPDATASAPKPCTRCAERGRCEPPDPSYVERFGALELRPR